MTENIFRIDTREKNWRDIVPILNRLGVQFERVALEAGDYEINGVLIERKTIADLYSSIAVDDRFLTQPPKIAMLAKRAIFAVVGDTSFKCPSCGYETLDELKKMGIEYNSNVFYGALASLFVRYGIEIMWVRDDNQLVNIMARIAKKISEGKSGIPLRGIKTGYYRDKFAMRVHFITGISGISPKIGRGLLKQFKNIKSIINASMEELIQTEGIGQEKAERLYRLFNEEVEERE